ncbi:MAG: lysine--tRNA ligase [Gammaproteobacteria bacterium AqS3]|nr:lysine--tRNA ligase [Gammaproteobacteria bacterium AqS3]
MSDTPSEELQAGETGEPGAHQTELERRTGIVARWMRQGWNYPNAVGALDAIWDIHAAHAGSDREHLEGQRIEAAVAGRLMLIRRMGKANFATLQGDGAPGDWDDASGAAPNRIQLYLRPQDLDEASAALLDDLDLGDIVCARGFLFRTQRGELTVHVERLQALAKALIPHPEKHHGLADQEQRYRQRYLDLLGNPETAERFRRRARVLSVLRGELERSGFLEVETPMLQPLASGAAARAFATHHNALGADMFLRVAPELNLKRLIVGGLGRVYELNRNFRNEGLSRRHNPEFTMLEFYQAYAGFGEMMDLTETLCRTCAEAAAGVRFDSAGVEIDMASPFVRVRMYDAVAEAVPDLPGEKELRDPVVARECAGRCGVPLEDGWGSGRILLELFEHKVEPGLVQPTFVTHHPAEVSPLARAVDGDAYLTERFELFCGGLEVANGFSELNDPEEQLGRFAQQQREREGGDDEAMLTDEDYVRALRYGMPPTGGVGIGIDRLVMLLTDSSSIRDVVLFPQLRQVDGSASPEAGGEPEG